MTPLETVRSQLPSLLPRLRRFARTLARHSADADDLVQIGIERAWLRIDQWDSTRALENWMFGIIRNAWLDELRNRKRDDKLFAPEESAEHIGSNPIEATAVQLSVHDAMLRLPEEQRSAVALVLIEGLSYKEAAETMQIPIGTLTSRLARGRDSLQKMLGES
jgi:RNA polymerase sigma-70 factor (ECF subfamily)